MQPAADMRVVHALEAIIDAAAGVFAEESLTATLNGMVRELRAIVPFSSLAVYEVDRAAGVLVPVYAVGRYVEETLADRPPLEDSISGSVVLSGRVAHLDPSDLRMKLYPIPGTPTDSHEAIVAAPLLVGQEMIGTLTVWREDDEAELARTHRLGQPVALVLFDLDDFKAINDRYGHPAGDAALRGFADVLRSHARASDLACRIGGEEFAVLLPGATEQEAARYAERALAATRAARLRPGGALTASAGLASAAGPPTTSTELFSAADERLLHAKACGKDRLEAASPAA